MVKKQNTTIIFGNENDLLTGSVLSIMIVPPNGLLSSFSSLIRRSTASNAMKGAGVDSSQIMSEVSFKILPATVSSIILDTEVSANGRGNPNWEW